ATRLRKTFRVPWSKGGEKSPSSVSSIEMAKPISICAVSIARSWSKPAYARNKSIRLVRAQVGRRMSSFHIGAKKKQPVARSVSSVGRPKIDVARFPLPLFIDTKKIDFLIDS